MRLGVLSDEMRLSVNVFLPNMTHEKSIKLANYGMQN